MTGLARQRLDAARAAFGADDPRVAPAEITRAAVAVNFGTPDEARTLLAHAQAMLDRAGDHDSRVRAHLLFWQGAYTRYYEPPRAWDDHPTRHAIQLFRARHPDDDQYLEALLSGAGLACRAGRVEEAAAMTEELQRRAAARYGPDTLFTAMALAARGNLLLRSGHAAEAIPVVEQAIAGFQRFVGADSQDVILAQAMLAQANLTAGRADEAQRIFDAAQQRVTAVHGSDARLVQTMARHAVTLDKIRAGQFMHCGE